MANKVIITGKAHPLLSEQLTKKGFDVLYSPNIAYREIVEMGHDIVGLVLTTRIKVDINLIDACPHLKWIGRLGSGLELIDIPYAQSKGIQCESSPEGNRNAVAEQSLAMVLMMMNQLHVAIPEVKNFVWRRDENRGKELFGRTVGIIGFGNTGSSFAKLLQPFNVTVLAYDKYKSDFAEGYIKEASLEQVCKYSEIISLNVPLTDDTHHLCNMALLSSMSQRPIILNASRGKVIHTNDLMEALKQGLISGACLDVLENEKLDTYTAIEKEQLLWLTAQSNVIITPHIAGYSFEALEKMAIVLLKKLNLWS